MSGLNPQIVTMEVGVRKLHQITIYPLSMSDQFKCTDLITNFVSKTIEHLEGSQVKDIAAVPVIIKGIEKNLVQILDFVVDKNEKIKLGDLTNLQFSELAQLIYDVNYDGASKNFLALIAKVKSLLPSMGPSPQSSQKQVIDSNISIPDLIKPEE